jgi:hypothetical protein
MHFYWRIQQDLNCLGEYLIFREPCLNRCFRQWVQKNAAGIALAEDWIERPPAKAHLN